MIQAKVIADSICLKGHRLTTLEVIFPRYILAEKNTHRVLTKNSASSRAIPFKKMLKSVMENPFIPYAFQKDHKGMQGTEYFSNEELVSLPDFLSILRNTMGYKTDSEVDEEVFKLIGEILNKNAKVKKTLPEWWLYCRDKAVKCAILMASFGVTKQLANRLLEPFMYHKVLVSGTEWENFFNLRCPSYTFNDDDKDFIFKSRKDVIKYFGAKEEVEYEETNKTLEKLNIIDWLNVNTGQADIHMMFLAESIYDAINESVPKELKEGEWHIPYGDNINEKELEKFLDSEEPHNDGITSKLDTIKCKISIARCARLSYQTLGDNPEINYEKDLELYDNLSKSGHWSPFEHVAKVMTEKEYKYYINGKCDNVGTEDVPFSVIKAESQGWCRNFRGYIQQRSLMD